MSILIGLAHEPVFNAAVATQIVFQQPANPLPKGARGLIASDHFLCEQHYGHPGLFIRHIVIP
ncbi:hypothetical protein FVE88_00170 [Ectopseudomonas mendocina]|nr:hypothetical protein FVE88_00170 [Pseudomonas mendocina]